MHWRCYTELGEGIPEGAEWQSSVWSHPLLDLANWLIEITVKQKKAVKWTVKQGVSGRKAQPEQKLAIDLFWKKVEVVRIMQIIFFHHNNPVSHGLGWQAWKLKLHGTGTWSDDLDAGATTTSTCTEHKVVNSSWPARGYIVEVRRLGWDTVKKGISVLIWIPPSIDIIFNRTGVAW